MNNRVLVMVALAAGLFLGGRAWPKSGNEGKLVDSGSFGIYVQGRRVATETFSIRQRPDVSITVAEFKTEDGRENQSSELQIASNGDLRHYQWRGPDKAQTTVVYSDQFLVEHVTSGAGVKPVELPFMLPPSTVLLDDNFFVHREVLLWRYLASMCGPAPLPAGCQTGRFGVFIPRQQTPATVQLEYKGKEKIAIRGAEHELDRFSLVTDGVEWALWMGPDYKLVRILVPSERVEVLRD